MPILFLLKNNEVINMEIWNRDNKQVAFFPESLNSFEINDCTSDILKLLNEGATDEAIKGKTGVTYDELNKVKALFLKSTHTTLPREDRTDGHPTYLRRLSINISNTCNMKCKYCYANFGAYGSEKSLMSMDVLKMTLDKFYNAFDEIGVLQVFGGEPFLNFEGFKYICEYIDKRYKDGKMRYKTLITTVTNGTVVSRKVLDLINKYDIYVTVSLDGPKDVQNSNRIFLDNRGTFDKVIRNIRRMKEQTGQPKQIESTYTQADVENHMSVLDVIKFINSKFDDIALHVAPVSADKKECFALEDRSDFVNSVDDLFRYNRSHEQKANYLILDSMIHSLESPQERTNFCDAGVGLFSVSYTGYIYPCYMFIDQPGFALMNIQDKDFSRSALLEKARPYQEYNRKQEEQCQKCPIVNVCDGCMGMNYFATGNIHKAPKEDCDMKRKMVKNIVFNITNAS